MAYRDPKTVIERNYSKYSKVLNTNELIYLNLEIERFSDGKPFDEIKFLISKKALNEKGEVIIDGFKQTERGIDCQPILYQEWTHKINQWREYKSRKEFGDKKRLASYDSMSQEVAGSKKM